MEFGHQSKKDSSLTSKTKWYADVIVEYQVSRNLSAEKISKKYFYLIIKGDG